jgi:uncharacterized protein YbjT (DUF2867 family)
VASTTVAVHGATGTQGAAISDRLHSAGFDVRPLASRSVDLADADSLVAAYSGVDSVVVQLPLVFDEVALTYAEAIVRALATAKIERAVFNPNSLLPLAPVGDPFVDARVALARQLPSAVEHASVIGPASLYLENILQPWSIRRIVEHGELAYPAAGQIPAPWVSLDDIGDAIAAALRPDAPPAMTALTGPVPITGDQFAAAVGAAAGRQVRWVQLPLDEFGNT